ncbi:MAG: LuxR C-terminal-related transcriptional regulator [Actinomycetota bacterium]|nr:LuxR C-terminal-related transcriptional regulator [Actinomycetota bacterium]
MGRTALVEQLAAGRQRLTLVAAPPGSGKTTLLAAWQRLEGKGKPFAWLSIDGWDNDPVRFWVHVVEAIRAVRPAVGEKPLALLHAPRTSVVEEILPALINELDALDEEVVLVLDDYHSVENPDIHEALTFLVEHVPPALRLVIATRSDPPLPLARLRARGELLEVRAGDLRFKPEESVEFLNVILGLNLERDDVMRLHARTEGWAAGLYLAALSLRGRDDPSPFIAAFAGDDRLVVDYLGAEVLHGQPDAVRTFMLRTAILDRLCGPLCDAVTETSGSTETLMAIERANLFLVPLDGRRCWYRYHHLFRSLLLHELGRAEPKLISVLHRRASAWYRAANSVPEAIQHSLAAGDLEDAGELIAAHWNAFFNQGQLATIERWLDALPGDAVAADSRLCVARAWLALDHGRLGEVESWIEAAGSGRRADGRASLETAVVRTVFRFKTADIGRAHAAAQETLELAPEDALFPRTVAQCILGITLYWSGERDRALGVLEEAAELARSDSNDLAASYALGYLSVIHAEQTELEAADDLASEAMGLSDDPGFAEHFVVMMAHLGRAKVSQQRGELIEAERSASRALTLALRGAGRTEIAAARVLLAEVNRAQGAHERARELLRQARRELRDCPDPRGLEEVVARAERRAAPARAAARHQSSVEELSDRELAVLRLLDTDLSRREIGAALYVSLNTVKTHMRAILRKLGASRRDEAVERARSLGLL